MQEEANKLCVRRHFDELWNAGEFEEATEFFDSTFRILDSSIRMESPLRWLMPKPVDT